MFPLVAALICCAPEGLHLGVVNRVSPVCLLIGSCSQWAQADRAAIAAVPTTTAEVGVRPRAFVRCATQRDWSVRGCGVRGRTVVGGVDVAWVQVKPDSDMPAGRHDEGRSHSGTAPLPTVVMWSYRFGPGGTRQVTPAEVLWALSTPTMTASPLRVTL